MKVDNLEVGQVVKNYKELCTLLEVEQKKSGNSRNAQIKEIERHVKYSRDKQKYVIEEIYSKPLPKVDGRLIHHGNYKIHDSIKITHPEKCEFIIDSYEIDLNKKTFNSSDILLWKCGVCEKHFDEKIRNIAHLNKVKCKGCNKTKGSKDIYDNLSKYSIPFDEEITFPDLKVMQYLRFDYGLLKDNKVIALIEFDGQFHDTDIKVMEYDRIKDEYCATNGIPLLRIHHTEIKHLKVKLLTFLYSFYPTTVIANELLAASRKIEIENQKLLATVEANNKILKDLLEVIK